MDPDDYLGLVDEYRKEQRESGHHREHVTDPADFADAKVLLDDGEALLVMECAGCFQPLTVCQCAWEKEPDWVRAQRPSPRRRP